MLIKSFIDLGLDSVTGYLVSEFVLEDGLVVKNSFPTASGPMMPEVRMLSDFGCLNKYGVSAEEFIDFFGFNERITDKWKANLINAHQETVHRHGDDRGRS